jgi:multidrug efflux pump subunit AcrA (membrane-fusion protein)
MHNRLLILFACWFLSVTAQPQALAKTICQAQKATTTIILTGFTRPETILDITPEVSGRCDEILTDVGQPIPRDTIFARIDPTFIKLEMQANKIAMDLSKTTLAFDKKQVQRYKQLVTTKASAQTRLEELELKQEQTELRLRQLNTDRKRLGESLARHTLHAPAGWLLIAGKQPPPCCWPRNFFSASGSASAWRNWRCGRAGSPSLPPMLTCFSI